MERKLSPAELSLMQMILSANKEGEQYLPALSDCLVIEMNDGGMGGLVFQSNNTERKFGKELSSVEFDDQDGVRVFASVNLDQYGKLFELDIWKTDFSALLHMPGDDQ